MFVENEHVHQKGHAFAPGPAPDVAGGVGPNRRTCLHYECTSKHGPTDVNHGVLEDVQQEKYAFAPVYAAGGAGPDRPTCFHHDRCTSEYGLTGVHYRAGGLEDNKRIQQEGHGAVPVPRPDGFHHGQDVGDHGSNHRVVESSS